MISYTKIKDQIKQTLTLKEIVEFYIGNDVAYNGRYKCPFNKKEEHYNLEVKNKTWKCYSCGDSGDEIAFVQKLFNFNTYKEAVMQIAVDFNLDTECKKDPSYYLRINAIKEKRKKEEEEKIKFHNSEIELFDMLLSVENNLKNKIKDNNIEDENFDANEYIKHCKSLSKVKIVLDMLTQQDVDLKYFLYYDININDENCREQLSRKVVERYMNGEKILR